MRQIASRLICVTALVAIAAGCGGRGGSASSPAASHAASSRSTASATDGGYGLLTVRRLTWRLPQPVARQAVAGHSATTVMLAGGLLAGDATTASAYRLNLRTGRVVPLPPLSVPVHDAAGGSFDGRPAVFGGGGSSEQRVVQVLGRTRWNVGAQLPTTRSDLSVIESGDGSTYVIGGYDGVGTPREILGFAGSRMTRVGWLSNGVRYAATALIGDRAYVFGGEVNGHELGGVQRVNLTTGRAHVVATLPHPLGHAMAMAVSGRILLVGGTTSYQVRTSQAWWFDPSSDRFRSAGRLSVPISDAVLVPFSGGAMVLGGQVGQGSGGETDRAMGLSWR